VSKEKTAKPPVARSRGRPRKSETRHEGAKSEQLFHAALRSFAEHGYEATSLRKIAAEVGVDVALIAHNFGSKRELWDQVINRIGDDLISAIRTFAEGEAGGATAIAKLHHAMDSLVDLFCDTPYLAEFVIREATQPEARSDYKYEKLIRPVHDLLAPLFKQASAEGSLPSIDADFFIFAFAGALALTVSGRPFLATFSAKARSDKTFRQNLKQSVLLPLKAGA